GVALELVPTADAEVAAQREEPAADPLRVRDRVPDVVDRSRVVALEADQAALAGGQRCPAGRTSDGLDLADDVDHRWSPRAWVWGSVGSVAPLASRRRRSRLPRASSVARESRRWLQNPRKGSSQSSS